MSIYLDIGMVLFAAVLALLMWRQDQRSDEDLRREARRQEIIDRISKGV